MLRVLFLEGERVAFDGANVNRNLHDGDESLRSDVGFRGDDNNLHDDGKNVRGSVNDDGFSHNGDESEESDEKGNDMTVSDGDDGIRSVLICGDSHDGNVQKVNDDDGNGDRIDDDGNRDHKFRGKCF